MPEFDNDSDRLEQFFRKATNKPDLAFSEDDWSRLEARLDAADAAGAAKVETPKKTIITAAVVAILLLSSVGIWWGSETEPGATNNERANVSSPVATPSQSEELQRKHEIVGTEDNNTSGRTRTAEENTSAVTGDGTSSVEEKVTSPLEQTTSPSVDATHPASVKDVFADDRNADTQQRSLAGTIGNEVVAAGLANSPAPNDGVADDVQHRRKNDEFASTSKDRQLTNASSEQPQAIALVPLADGKVRTELVISGSDITERNKQKARIELPGAEEADQTGRQTMVEEEHASEKEHVAKPRLSLLLSFAPDFSGTSLNQYSPPGKAFGGMIHYHFMNRWSISAGVIKNYKQYTGSGEDYTPPTGYWKYYTNGVIPETIDGSCSVLEFPIMVQYTIRDRGKNRWVVGAGASSYLMQTESYRYHFAQPNPGAKDGWDSRGSARFMFNMLNLSVGYEHQIIPGLMIGLEPYVKLPLEEIGWSNLRLYSSGASITLRYTLIGKKQLLPLAVRSRGPD